MISMTLTNIRNLIAGYFHEDWRLEATSHEDAVRQFVEREPSDCVADARAELDALLAASISDAELRALVIGKWGSGYDPELEARTIRNWLEEIRLALVRHKK